MGAFIFTVLKSSSAAESYATDGDSQTEHDGAPANPLHHQMERVSANRMTLLGPLEIMLHSSHGVQQRLILICGNEITQKELKTPQSRHL